MKGVKVVLALVIVIILLLSSYAVMVFFKEKREKKEKEMEKYEGYNVIVMEYNFSEPVIREYNDYLNIYVDEANLYTIGDGRPVLPVNITVFEFPLGTRIVNISFEYSEPQSINLSKRLSFGSCSTLTNEDAIVYNSSIFPSTFVSHHTGGGLFYGKHRTFLVLRVYPVNYKPLDDEVEFIQHIRIKIVYKEPDTPVLEDEHIYDLLIISPPEFKKPLESLVKHKENNGVKTKLVTTDEIKSLQGRDEAEKIKYFIKQAVETWGVRYVLLVGGIKKQTSKWYIPVRYSHVVIRERVQEMVEDSFLSDLYYADLYDSNGNFSSWDSNGNGVYAEWRDGEWIDEMDLYPDVYLGRLACRNKYEVKTVVDKIIRYESESKGDWFNRIILVSGDHWDDPDHITEGVLIMEEASRIMSGFEPVKIYATAENKILVRDINRALNKGAGFAYFCGHGGASSWGIHYPPDAKGWGPSLGRLGFISFYNTFYMNFLRNRYKLPVVLVGGCYNGKFDITLFENLRHGRFGGRCWAWKLVAHRGGGSIATIANSALGTHAMGDADHNMVNDYLEVLDGWLELRFLRLYSEENSDILGLNHGQAITDYLNRFLGNNDEMDIKMVQQWILFGDPSLKIG